MLLALTKLLSQKSQTGLIDDGREFALLHQSIHFTGTNEYDFLVPFLYTTKQFWKIYS